MRISASSRRASARHEQPGGRRRDLSNDEMRTLRGGGFELGPAGSVLNPVTHQPLLNTDRIEQNLDQQVVCDLGKLNKPQPLDLVRLF